MWKFLAMCREVSYWWELWAKRSLVVLSQCTRTIWYHASGRAYLISWRINHSGRKIRLLLLLLIILLIKSINTFARSMLLHDWWKLIRNRLVNDLKSSNCMGLHTFLLLSKLVLKHLLCRSTLIPLCFS